MIESRRHRPGDLDAWRRLTCLDTMHAKSRSLTALEERALEVVAKFIQEGPAQISVSWGKDSVVVAHLATRLGHGPLAWYPAGEIENPECVLVRDAFLKDFDVKYIEIEAGLDTDEWNKLEGHDGAQVAFEVASRSVSRRYISGVRAEESGMRKLAMRVHGTRTKGTCRPIGWWKSEDVFAYLHKYNLPIHPAYAMLMGGRYPRDKIRVSTIGGSAGENMGRREWERYYYRDRLDILGIP